MKTIVTYTKSGEQLTLTLECSAIGELVSQDLAGQASFRKALEEHLAKSTGVYEDTLSLAFGAAEDFDLQHSVAYEGEPHNPDDLEFD
jgi:hypothetical protein